MSNNPFITRPDTPRFTGQGRPVFHRHGSRQHALYDAIDERRAIAESLEQERVAHQEAWIASASKRDRQDSDAALRRLRTILTGDAPAKTTHVTPEHRVAVYELAREAGLTSAQMLLVVNKQFGEYAKCASSTIATIVANDIRRWMEEPQSTVVLDAVRNGTF